MKLTQRTSIVLLAILLPVSPAAAEKLVRYELRDNPSDPNSPVAWTIDLKLVAVQSSGAQIGWAVDHVTIAQYASTGSLVASWTDTQPDVGTADGLWWVEHENPSEPENAEFSEPPLIQGVGGVEIGSSPDLAYSLEGEEPSAAPNLGRLTYSLIMTGWVDPIRGGEMEWVDIPIVYDPPIG